jgi:SAM-dependent methyltransferase
MAEMEVPQIFDLKAQALAKARAQKRMSRKGPSFLLTRCAQDAASRIADINRRFERGIVLAPIDMRSAILEDLPAERRPQQFDWSDNWEDIQGDYDLIISLLELQTENDLPGALIKMKQSLKADGLFMAAMFGGDSLITLRQSFYHIDQALFGGATARLYPMIDHTQAAGLLGRAGLNLPVIDKDRVTVNYRSLQTLINDLRDLGLTNILTARHKAPLPKGILSLIHAAYPKTSEGKFTAQLEILWLTGWSPHESQQKPLKPGSAKMRLADALGVSEKKV